ncbi:MAG: hypothetical protein BGO98_17645 [Myxococcales bacterium 68-20]|mgnify:CR=1 FL=1|nr:hypothetical protein [Myxococcales bacterium]OJY23768.1 MAG: hypothetical protein BGO98_17645 [Myxococcales bacterium 68-20]
MSQRDTSLLLREYAEWATANRFSTHLHDAQFHGLLRNTPVGIETGIRDSNLYVVVTTIYFACGLGTKVLREADARPDDPPLVLRLRHVLKSGRPVLSIRLDDAMITLRMEPGSRPADVGEVANKLLSIVQSAGAELGPYR